MPSGAKSPHLWLVYGTGEPVPFQDRFLHRARPISRLSAASADGSCCGGQGLRDIDPLCWVFAGVAGRAVVIVFSPIASLLQSFERQVAERVCFDVLANVFDRTVGGNQLTFIRSVDSVIAGGDG